MTNTSLPPKIYTKEKFGELVEAEKNKYGDSYLNTILTVCENEGIEFELVPQLLPTPMKDRLRAECSDKHLLKEKPHKKLPL